MKGIYRLLCVVMLVVFSGQVHGQVVVSTVAGNGNTGYCCDGDSAVHAQVSSPGDVAVDAMGNVYIADQGNNRVRVIDTFGIIRTIAGNGTAGYAGDSTDALNSMLNHPLGIAIAKNGRVYIADNGNNVVRMIDTNGFIYTVAGTGVQGNTGDEGSALQATFYGPERLYVDDTGSLYICDIGNNRVRKVDTFGIVHAFAGTGNYGNGGDGGLATDADLKQPAAITRDRFGNFYISDYSGARIRKVAGTGIISTFAGNGNFTYSGDGGMADTAALNGPSGIIADSAGNVYFADYINNRIRVIDGSGVITTYGGTGVSAYNGEGLTPLAANMAPYGIAMNSKGDMYFTDLANSRVRRIGLPLPPPSGVKNMEGNAVNIMLFPNPATGDFTVQTNMTVTKGRMCIYDVSGRVVYSQPLQGQKTSVHTALGAGVYIVSVMDDMGTAHRERLVMVR